MGAFLGIVLTLFKTLARLKTLATEKYNIKEWISTLVYPNVPNRSGSLIYGVSKIAMPMFKTGHGYINTYQTVEDS